MDERIYALRKDAKLRGEPILRDKSFDLLIERVKDCSPKNILEIGANEGLSGIAMLLTAKTARLSAIEIDEDKAAKAQNNYRTFGVEDRAKIFLGNASEIIPLLSGKYDFIFLDGPKGHYAEYCDYLIDALTVGGILFADNVLYRGYVGKDKKVPHRHATIKNGMEKFIDKITSAKNLETVIFEIEDGVSVTKKLYE